MKDSIKDIPCLQYTDIPNFLQKVHRELRIFSAGGDYFIAISDEDRTMLFRYCISGGFEMTHPKITKAIAKLCSAFQQETSQP